MKTIKREYVSLDEETETGYSLKDSSNVVTRRWVATVDGPLSTGEAVHIVREGKTAQEAYRALEFALYEQDWEIE